MKVSILLYVHNDINIISVIENILKQTHKNIEIIIINDGSDMDKTIILKDYLLLIKEIDINYIEHTHKGFSQSLNIGLNLIKSDYFTCIKVSNIIYYENYLYELLRYIGPDYLFAYSDFILIQEGRHYVNTLYNDINDLIYNYREIGSYMWHRNIINYIGYFNTSLDNDTYIIYDYIIRTFLKTNKIIHINKCLSEIDMLCYNYNYNYKNIILKLYSFYLEQLIHKKIHISTDIKIYTDIDTSNVILCTNKYIYEILCIIENTLYINFNYEQFITNLILIHKNNVISFNENNKLSFIDKEDIYIPVIKNLTIKYIEYEKNMYTFYHNNNKNFIINILKTRYIVDKSIMLFPSNINFPNYLKKELESENDNTLYVFTSIDYANFLLCIANNILTIDLFLSFINKKKYIFIHYEVLINNNLEQIGLNLNFINKDILKIFYKNALYCLLCNNANIKYLHYNNIYNVKYFPQEGYSLINKYVPLDSNNNKNIDILIYGNIHPTFIHRNKIIESVKNFSKINNYNLVIRDNDLEDNYKNEILSNTKIVLHVPSHEKLQTIPWAKIMELMCKKIFFIIEKTDENLNEIIEYLPNIIYYTSIGNLYEKIKFYLNNPIEINNIVNSSFNIVKTRYNIDEFYKNLNFRYSIVKYITFPSIHYLFFYNNKLKSYINILKYYFDIRIETVYSKTFLFNNLLYPEEIEYLKKFLETRTNEIYIFDELVYSHFLSLYLTSPYNKKIIQDFLNKANYINFFCEIFENDSLKTLGNNSFNNEYSILFFSNSKKNILCNINNINILKKYNINSEYFCPLGYSIVNNIIPLKINDDKYIDVLFMGNINDNIRHVYRDTQINKLKEYCTINNYTFKIFNGCLFEEKDNILKNTKIVIHIPSYENLNTFPWAKVGELMSKKIFFLIENNNELLYKKLNEVVAYYNPSIENNMLDMIKYFIENEDARNTYIDLCFNFIYSSCNMDLYIKNILY